MGRETREQAGVRYRQLTSRSLLNRCDSPRMPFEWTVNPYRGCAMGCRYCYAAYTHEFMGITTPEDFHHVVYVKVGAERGTARRLLSVLRRDESIALGTATDPYQPEEARSRVTRRFLELVAQHRNVRLGITTKGPLILRDLDLLRRIHGRSSLSIQVSLTSLRADLLRRLEPWAPPPEVRIEVLRRLAGAGLRVCLGVAPVLPALTDDERDLDELLGRVRGVGVTRMFFNVLFLRSPTKEKYLRWVAAEFPQHLEAYRKAYDGQVYLRGRYRRRVEEMMERLRERHGFTPREPPAASREAAAEQLRLWT
jgi:DNA repair photolyase